MNDEEIIDKMKKWFPMYTAEGKVVEMLSSALLEARLSERKKWADEKKALQFELNELKIAFEGMSILREKEEKEKKELEENLEKIQKRIFAKHLKTVAKHEVYKAYIVKKIEKMFKEQSWSLDTDVLVDVINLIKGEK